MSAPKKMTVKNLSEEFFKLQDEVKEFATLKNKIFELENALKQCNGEKEILKAKFEALEQRLENIGLGSKEDQSEKIQSRNEIACKKCDDRFEGKNKLKEHMNLNHKKTLKCNRVSLPLLFILIWKSI